jgi:hypothetical protein
VRETARRAAAWFGITIRRQPRSAPCGNRTQPLPTLFRSPPPTAAFKPWGKLSVRSNQRLGLLSVPVARVSTDRSSPGPLPQKASLWLLTHRDPPGHFPPIGRQSHRSLPGVSPETRRSPSDRRSEGLRRVSGETTARPARVTGAVSEGIAGGVNMIIWQPYHKGFSASHWHPGTSVADDSRHLDGAKSLLGVSVPSGNRPQNRVLPRLIEPVTIPRS